MKAYVWSLPTRVFHMMFAAFIAAAILSGDEDSLLNIHASLGYAIGVLVVYRIVWGFAGPRYSRFSDFPLSLKELKEFMLNIFDHKKYAGHNPAASFVMVTMLIVVFLTVATGILAYGIQEGRGILGFLNSPYFKEMKLFKEIHEFFSTFLMILIAAHLGGVAFDRLIDKKTDTLGSIVNGHKNIDAPSVTLNLFQKLFSFFALTLAAGVLFYSLFFNSVLTKSTHKEISYEKEHSAFVAECASCHTLYPPHLLSRASWEKVMNSLDDHFGDDASLDEQTRVSIRDYLMKNSAESSTKESAFYILNSLKKSEDIIAVTQTPYWKHRHKSIDKNIFSSKEIKSKANCKACHSDIERGLIEDSNIKIPKIGV
ncbi:cytochrome b/b6 domain-containing protein [Sulfurimonas sp. HSL-1716]|uniref:cytochrome b/b6 domain-containing protein n=1 Tax=Hydrocurvibacter sulfurireducens TaxID=3131937 RepID=UPI0031FA3614